MAVHINEVESEVVVEDRNAPSQPRAQTQWQQLQILRLLSAAAERDRQRTCARGNDD